MEKCHRTQDEDDSKNPPMSGNTIACQPYAIHAYIMSISHCVMYANTNARQPSCPSCW
ncbi:50S ribosomal protein L35 [Zea mays]|uniref:50S ribosomal protein L35 n=1 Tax=Zea mays TaxID=4577 RepID=A0A1D6JJM8_MAIZE|nr:50S ribosomal protein L35 [Zea mays]